MLMYIEESHTFYLLKKKPIHVANEAWQSWYIPISTKKCYPKLLF